MAAIDGIQNKTSPGEPLDRDIYEMTPEELARYPKTPATLDEAIEALEADHAFLTAGGVFTDDLVEAWITWKREEELVPLALRPHPYEFHMYYDS
jgi:glutamine synthetase